MVWSDSLPGLLAEGAGLQQMFCCLTASTARTLPCMADAEFRVQVVVEVVVACTENQFQFQFQLKMASQRSERPIRAPPRLSAVSPRLPSKQCQYLPG